MITHPLGQILCFLAVLMHSCFLSLAPVLRPEPGCSTSALGVVVYLPLAQGFQPPSKEGIWEVIWMEYLFCKWIIIIRYLYYNYYSNVL